MCIWLLHVIDTLAERRRPCLADVSLRTSSHLFIIASLEDHPALLMTAQSPIQSSASACLLSASLKGCRMCVSSIFFFSFLKFHEDVSRGRSFFFFICHMGSPWSLAQCGRTISLSLFSSGKYYDHFVINSPSSFSFPAFWGRRSFFFPQDPG